MKRAVQQLWRRIGTTPVATPADARSRTRYRRVLLSAVSNFFTKTINMTVMLISVPLLVDYLGAERFGMWATVSSLILVLGTADLGIGNGLINHLAASHGRDDTAAVRRQISTGLFVLLGLGMLVALGGMLLGPLVPWARIFNVSSPQAMAEAWPTVAACLAIVAMAVPVSVVEKSQIGSQRGYIAAFWVGVGRLIGLGGLFAVIALGGGTPDFVWVGAGALVLAQFINGWLEFTHRHREWRPRLRDWHRPTAGALFRTGGLFFTLNIAMMVAFQSDYWVLSAILGPEAVTSYHVVQRLFSIPPMVLSVVLGPLWPAYAEARARGDAAWIRATFRRSLVLSVAIAVPSAAGLFFTGDWLILLWVGGSVVPGLELRLAAAAFLVVLSLSGPVAMLLNGLTVVRFQVVAAISMAIVNVGLSIALSHAYGIPGVLWGSAIALTVCTLIPAALVIRKYLDRLAPSRPDAAHSPGDARHS